MSESWLWLTNIWRLPEMGAGTPILGTPHMYIYICYVRADGDDNIICWQYVLTRVVSSPPYQPLADHTSSLTPPKKWFQQGTKLFSTPGCIHPGSASALPTNPRDWDMPNSMWSTACHQKQWTQTTFWTCDGLNLSTSWLNPIPSGELT